MDFELTNYEDCSKCMEANWIDESGNNLPFILGLLKAYMDKNRFQIVDLLEYIQYFKQNFNQKKKIAEYAFCENPEFKKFGELIEDYHRCPENAIGDSQIVLARLAKEGLIHQIVTTNWDDLMELACYAVDMYVKTCDNHIYGQIGEELSQDKDQVKKKLAYKNFVNHAVAVSEAENFYDSQNLLAPTKKTFYIYKIHGGIDKIIQELEHQKRSSNDEAEFNANLVITHRDLIDWRYDHWSEDLVKSILRSHDVVFAGISGRDNVIYATVRRLIEEISRIFDHKSDIKNTKEAIKRVFSVNVQRELILSNMLSKTNWVDSHFVDVNQHVKYGTIHGTDLFYRWFYVFYILQAFVINQETHIRDTVLYLNHGKYDTDKYKEYLKLIREFFNYAFLDINKIKTEKQLKLMVSFIDIFYDVIPKSLNYTWLINTDLLPVLAEKGGTNFLMKKPHLYLPVFSYCEWFTLYIVMFAKLYNLIEKYKSKIIHFETTSDGVIIINGVAFIFIIEQNSFWKILQKATSLDFSKDSEQLINRCWKKVVLSWDISKNDFQGQGSKFFISRNFEYYKLEEENFIGQMRKILEIEED
ncbi:MAG: SIR2 family protein [Halanaerobiales bacterium]|nr:SIR2 family protein [Halanaerobiales bacterium]